ncbi:hypothetical protein [Kaistia terrae]|uniref:Tetratricopeptide repeat protein n=1 Tax=Kaistia terrae TaxID=537017 RepID=A0ABW0PW29_9HYPH|nr:hypothetical protein [Kaistia terrae]MCX5576732.1 hypothetical protein [Kaistia terrae]
MATASLKRNNRPIAIAIWSAALVLSLLVLVEGLSRSVETSAPQSALRLNPLNADARVASLSSALNGQDEPQPDPAALVDDAKRGLWLAPVDARFLSLLGEVRQRQGDRAAAEQLFASAHRVSPTELHALSQLILAAGDRGDVVEAVGLLDVMLRRWPSELKGIESALPGLLASPEGHQAVLDVLQAAPPWRTRFLAALARSDAGLPLASSLLLNLSDSAAFPTPGEISTVVNGFLRAKRYDDAHRLFLLTLSDADFGRTGLVHNGRFDAAASPSPFNWQFASTSAAEVRFDGAPPYAGAGVRFLNKPARDIRLRQTVLLGPGRYRLAAETSAVSLVVPRGLYWSVRCLTPSREIARIDVDPGTYRDRQISTEFEVDDCAAQSVELRSGLVADSWVYRYSGRATFHSLGIERIDRAASGN